ncbi:hypothetical protein A2U01_0082920, partial [Trifolium medium]|nr:hypothetical protein [Trifolium medium]
MSTRGGKMPAELLHQILQREDRLGGQALVPCHGPLPQCGRKEPASDGSTDHAEVEDGIDVVNM